MAQITPPAHARARSLPIAQTPNWLRLAAATGLALSIGLAFVSRPAGAQDTGLEPGEMMEGSRSAIPVREIRTFTEVFAKIKADYVEAVDDKKLLEDAIRGMLAGLDPHSAYLDPKEYAGLQEGTTGEFGGVGIEVGMEDGFVKVIAPMDGTPAAEAGILPGDIIVRIDDVPVKGISLNDAVKRMRGAPGSEIKLTVSREGETGPLEFTLARAVVQVSSVRERMLDDGYGYLRIANFQARTGEDSGEALKRLKAQAGGSLKGLIIDLRNNPGGVLGAAAGVSDLFLTSGRIVYTEGRVDDSQMSFSAKGVDELAGAPLVVLVNEGSASASEIVAGALQDQKRALIVGRRTFGKGSVQTILPMNNNAAIKLTTARYYTPNGRSIQAEGIVPDITLDRVQVASIDAVALPRVKEADLDRHLENADTPAKKRDDDMPGREELALSDYELYEALNLLKGMALFGAAR